MNKSYVIEQKEIRAVGAGFSCIDVYENLGKFYPTGNNVDWGVHLSRMGIPVSIVSVVGTDKYGKLMIEALNKENINTSHLHEKDGDTCKMIMGLRGNDRVHLEEVEGVMADFTISEEDIEFIKAHDYLHMDLFGKILNHLPMFKEAGLKIVMDFSVFFDDPEYNAFSYLPYVDYAFFSYKQHDEYIEDLIKRAQSLGPKVVVATLGEHGSIAWDGEELYECPAIPVEVVNTVGAGDAFIAGFTYGTMKGYSVLECMKKGSETSSKVIVKFEPY